MSGEDVVSACPNSSDSTSADSAPSFMDVCSTFLLDSTHTQILKGLVTTLFVFTTSFYFLQDESFSFVDPSNNFKDPRGGCETHPSGALYL